MSIVRKQPTLLVLLGWVALTTFAALTQTAFAYQDPAKQASVTLKDHKSIQTAFTYQGQLKDGSMLANGTFSFRFALYTGQSGGRNLGVVIKDDVVVNKGSFTVQLDFGSDGFSSNESWLDVGARRANTADSYTELSPRQQLTPMLSAITAQAEPRTVIGVPLAPQDVGPWIKDGRTVRLAVSTDNVGIGTTKPVATLDVAGTIHASEAVTVGNSVGLLSSSSLNLIEVDNSNPLAIGLSNPFSTTPNPVAFASIKVGIGTTSPTHTLDINGPARIRSLTTFSTLNDVVVADPNGVLFKRPASTIGGAASWLLAGNLLTGSEILGSLNSFPLKVVTVGFERMRIDTNGNVGIATTTPTQKLTLGSGNALLANAQGGTDGNLYFGGITDNNQTGMRLFGGLVNNTTPGGFIDVRVNPSNLADGLRFRIDGNNGGTERMRITAAGNVGIGTPAPNERLEITGNFRMPFSTASVGVIKSGQFRFIHNCCVTPSAFPVGNFFGGVNAGNLTMSPNATDNVGVGAAALASLTTGGDNTAVGSRALIANTTGQANTAVGRDSLRGTTTGILNTSVGTSAMFSNGTGSSNTVVGANALSQNVTGGNNTAVGVFALNSNTGSNNTALGTNAGSALTNGSNNIYIGNAGTATESTTIRIGTPQNRTFIAGIRNVTTGVANALPVVIDGNGQLGTVSSSRRFKEHIEDLGATSRVLYSLRPVSFLYKPEYGGRSDLRQFGLIAEEVAKVAPELVVYDDQGKPYTVNYQFLAPMLLNEMQKKDAEIEKLRARLDALEQLVRGLTKK